MSMSLSGPGRSNGMRDAVDRAAKAGIAVIVAAGNQAVAVLKYNLCGTSNAFYLQFT